jgi:hypothetical protein
VLEPLTIVIDVAGVYDHSLLRYDHHQRGFFGPPLHAPLSHPSRLHTAAAARCCASSHRRRRCASVHRCRRRCGLRLGRFVHRACGACAWSLVGARRDV